MIFSIHHVIDPFEYGEVIASVNITIIKIKKKVELVMF